MQRNRISQLIFELLCRAETLKTEHFFFLNSELETIPTGNKSNCQMPAKFPKSQRKISSEMK